jgi:hypothetical protein
VGNTNFKKKKKFQTRRKIIRPLSGCVTFLRVRREIFLKNVVALARRLSYSSSADSNGICACVRYFFFIGVVSKRFFLDCGNFFVEFLLDGVAV